MVRKKSSHSYEQMRWMVWNFAQRTIAFCYGPKLPGPNLKPNPNT
ncbi:hypothetical protein ERO13_A01G123966v2 [Gossypium hirsutum]|nr:hypothetical protein ERO13_A01G123966v2 [Gossypium hirsutum]